MRKKNVKFNIIQIREQQQYLHPKLELRILSRDSRKREIIPSTECPMSEDIFLDNCLFRSLLWLNWMKVRILIKRSNTYYKLICTWQFIVLPFYPPSRSTSKRGSLSLCQSDCGIKRSSRSGRSFPGVSRTSFPREMKNPAAELATPRALRGK